MRTLYVAWQTPAPTRAWFPIGRLDADVARNAYLFRYTHGALRASREYGFVPLPSFPDFEKAYESGELFPLFKNRVLGSKRKDFVEYLRWLDLNQSNADPIEILALTGGARQTDSLEIFPKIDQRPDGAFSYRFFLHGLRHVSSAARQRAEKLNPLEPLQVALELNNPATGYAVQLQTGDAHLIGWTPRYLVPDLVMAISEHPNVSASVVRVNREPAPLAHRILVELAGRFPKDAAPMSAGDFKPVVANPTLLPA